MADGLRRCSNFSGFCGGCRETGVWLSSPAMSRVHSNPFNPTLRAWLHAEGSLTARLRGHGTVEVMVLRQGAQRLWPAEQDDLNCPNGYVREVALLLDGIPVVWARSAVSHHALRGPWKALTNLGNRPLAELLFRDKSIERNRLKPHHFPRHGLMECRLRNSWTGLHAAMPAGLLPRWARSSVFWHQGQPLRVLEAFAPWIVRLKVG